MGTWNNLQKGFTVNERLPDTLVDVAVCNVYFGVANIHRQKEQIKRILSGKPVPASPLTT